jgi:hypothetical protein
MSDSDSAELILTILSWDLLLHAMLAVKFLVTLRHIGEMLGRLRIKLISNSGGPYRSMQRLWPQA